MARHTFLGIQRATFQKLGVEILFRTNAYDRKCWTYMLCVLLAFYLIPEVFGIIAVRNDLDLVTEGLTSLPAGLLSLKFAHFLYHRRSLVELLCAAKDILDAEASENSVYAEIAAAQIQHEQIFSIAYSYSLWTAGALAILRPMIVMLVHYLQTSDMIYVMPYVTVFPWRVDKALNFTLTFAWTIISCYGCVLMTIASDTLLFAFIYNVCAIFKIGQHKFRNFHQQGDDCKELIKILKYHQTSLEIAGKLETMYRSIIPIQFACVSFELCMVGMQIANKFTQPEIVYFLVFYLALLIETYIYANCGEKLKAESLAYAQAIGDRDWYEMPEAGKRLLLFALMRAQIPCRLRGFLIEANMETFILILRTATSYMTILLSFK